MAKTLVLGLLESYRSLYGKRLEQAEKSGATSEKRVAHLLDGIQKRRAERPRLEQLLQEAGMASMALDALDSAIGQLDHERRLNEIDLAGLEASLAAARERIAALAGKATDVQADVLRVLHRLQVEFEIQVVGKTARKEALARELAQLKSSRDARARLLAFAEEDEKANRALPEENNSVRRSEQAIAALREALTNAPVDNRVTIAPLARVRP